MDDGQAAFEAARIAELAANGVGADVAKVVAKDEWHQMDDAAKSWCRQQAAVVITSVESPVADSLESGCHQLATERIEIVDHDEVPVVEMLSRSPPRSSAASKVAQGKKSPGAKKESTQARKRKAAEVIPLNVETSHPDTKRSVKEESKGWLCVHSGIGYERHIEDASHDKNDKDLDIEMFHAFRTSSNVSVGGMHPDWLTEPSSVSQISLPVLSKDTLLRLPPIVAKDSLLSSPQLESVAYAARRFTSFLPNGSRCGYFLGDGTGCGKGRVIAALVWHLWNTGARRHVWLSATADLIEDAVRDFRDLGANLPISNLSKWSYGKIGTGKGLDNSGNGVMFASYSLFVSSSSTRGGSPSPDNSRLMQLIDWLRRDADSGMGLIALDEAHRAKNVGDETMRRNMKGSKAGLSALELVRACPKCAVLYSSATGATEIRHLGYLERLGLWGPGRPHTSFADLQTAVENGGLAAMELIAMTMRAEGMLSCRALSFKGTSFRLQQVHIAGSMRETYIAACACWQEAYRLLVEISKAAKAAKRAKKLKIKITDDDLALTHRYFWGYQQQFFKQLLVCAKLEETVALAQAAIIRNEAVVIAMWSTGEAITSQKLQRENSATSDEFASAPREVAQRLIDKVLMPFASEAQHEARLRQLTESFRKLQLPPNPLDDLIHRLGGPSQVAELTGRSRRLVGAGSKEMYLQERVEGSNLQEQKAFQSGEKRIAVITEAASAGISLHCDMRLPAGAQRPRYMIAIELPWEADKAVQQLGRVHRSNQKVPPKFAVVVTELGGEVRFVSAVARRLRILGAMMRGDRNSAHGAVQSLAAFDLQNRYGRRALSRFYELLRTDQYGTPEVTFSFLKSRGQRAGHRRWPSWEIFCKEAVNALTSIGLRPDSDDKYDESLSASKSLNAFMNRILMLEPSMQNALFDGVAELYSYMIGQDRAEGSFDGGLESLDRQGRQKASVSVVSREVLYKDPETCAETTYVRLRIDRSISWEAVHQTWEHDCDTYLEGFYWLQGKREVVLAVMRPRLQARPGMDDDDEEDPLYDLLAPRGSANRHAGRLVTGEMLQGSPFQKASDSELAQIERVWKTQLALVGDARLSDAHVLSGSILNTWAVVESAMGQTSSPARAGMPRKIPLVRAQLSNGKAVVGVRVRPDCLKGVRYALDQLRQQASECRARGSEPASLDVALEESVEDALVEHELPSVEDLGERVEECLKDFPDSRVENGWAGVHAALVEAGVMDRGARGMVVVQEAVDHLERNGKVEIDKATGAVTLLKKQRGCGWWIPPPKKPKTKSRGRGRGRG